ncbi:MAG: adenylate/guanylate cyclase domain-containing protein [Sandaracinaceae bacterium]
MRLSFRVVLLLALIVVPLSAVTVVAILSYRNAALIVDDLSERVLQQTSDRIHQEVQTLLDEASVVSRVHRSALSGRELGFDDLPEIVIGFHRVIREHPRLTYLSVGLETGDYGHVFRQPDGGLEVRLRRMRPEGGLSDRTDYHLVDGELVQHRQGADAYDPRVRPFYRAARRTRGQTWPDVYLFSNAPNPDVPGLTCATPVYDRDGDLAAVLTADFDLIALGEFLDEMHPFESGEAFVVERGDSGEIRVIAHPSPSILVGEVQGEGGEPQADILPVARIDNPVVRSFMAQVPERWQESRGTITRVAFQVGPDDYVGAWRPLIGEHDARWLIAVVVPEHELMARVERTNLENLVIGVISLLLLTIVGIALAARISSPLARLAEETAAIGSFRLDPAAPLRTNLTELDRLAASVEEMKAGLRSFGKFVPAELVRSLLESGQEAEKGGERRVMTVYFSDIVGFTSVAEPMDPEELLELMSEYFGVMSRAIQSAGGTVDKYIGDAVMAFWGAPLPNPNHARDACRAALATQARLAELRREWAKAGLPELRMRVGLNTGELIVGNIGSQDRLTYTVVGDPVNLASRLEGLNKHFGTSTLISESTFAQARADVVARPLDKVSVKGKAEGVVVYELLAMQEDATDGDLALADAASRALEAYLARRFTEAAEAFEEVLRYRPGDVAATALAQRARDFAAVPPPGSWDGVTRMSRK